MLGLGRSAPWGRDVLGRGSLGAGLPRGGASRGRGSLGLCSSFFVPTTLRCRLLSLPGGLMPGDPNQGRPVILSPPTQAERGASRI